MRQRGRLTTHVGLWVLSSFFVVVGVAQAAGGTPASAQYARPVVTPPKSGTLGSTGGGETLPFTGLSLALIVAAGLALVVVGVFARRRARATS